jgi:hypothetical protein
MILFGHSSHIFVPASTFGDLALALDNPRFSGIWPESDLTSRDDHSQNSTVKLGTRSKSRRLREINLAL